jgi:hypothetical protein
MYLQGVETGGEEKSQLGKQFGFVFSSGSTSTCPNFELQSHNT